jgi:Na+/H+-dicarboxylate symporter
MKESTRVVVALAAALGGGALIAASGSKPLIDAADAVAPVGTLWVSAIRMTVIPLVVSLLITGVASATDVGAIGRIGGRTLVVFVLLLAAIAAIVMPLAPALFALLPLPSTVGAKPALPAGAVEAANQVATSGQNPSFSAWLTSLIPSNPIAAAANGAMVPLILFTLILAIAIAKSPESTRAPLVGLARAVGDAMLLIVRWVVLVAPVGVFALVLPLAAHLGGAKGRSAFRE